MTTITLHDNDGIAHNAAFRAIEERADATIGLATLSAEGATLRVPAVVYRDGTIICATDWQGCNMDDEEVIDEASDPTWAHHWAGPNGEPVVILDGLPRLVG